MSKILREYLASSAQDFPDDAYGTVRRCSLTLNDGVVLPCAVIREKSVIVDMAIRRFKEEKDGKGALRLFKEPYREIVGNFVAEGNCVDGNDIKAVGPSKICPSNKSNQANSRRNQYVLDWLGI